MKPAQFIVWRSVPDPLGKKPKKIPYNPVTRENINAHDPAQWMSQDAAASLVALYGVSGGVSYVLTADDPYWCVDLDAVAQPDGTWSPFALEVLAMFPGAMVELSYSGDGLHIWGRGDAPDGHKTSDKACPGLEVYSQKRFMALGTSAIGDCETEHTAALCGLLARYLPGTRADAFSWTTVPVTDWSGPADDDELIKRMLAATPALADMMNTASLTDLWDADASALSKKYPSATPGEIWNGNQADSALCTHLAWWTGKDCERMDRLFRRSKLMREKWDRKDYMLRTVTGSCGVGDGSVYRQPGADMTAPEATLAEATMRDGVQMLDGMQQIDFFKGCAWVRDSNTVMVPDGAQLNQGQFNAAYGGYDLICDYSGSKMAKGAWDAFTNSRLVSFPKVHSTCFRPDEPPDAIITEENQTKINTYRPLDVASVPGDVSPFLDLITRQFPDPTDRSIIMAYAAACVQHPGAKFQWAPLVQGAEGNGKTFLATCISYAVGMRYCHTPNPHDIANKFNAWMGNKVFAVVEEIYTRNKFDVTEALKPMITNRVMENQGKGADQKTVENCVKFFMTTNHRDAIIKTRDDRRYAVFYMAQQTYADILAHGMGGDYFPRLHRWLNTGGAAHVTHYLKSYEIPDALNPAQDSNRAPETTSTRAAIAESLGAVEQLILEAVGDDAPGFKGGYVSSIALNRLLQHFKIAPRKRNSIMETVGYVTHPGLTDGRTTRSPGPEDDMKRITLYVRVAGIEAHVRGVDQIIADYRAKQGWASQVPALGVVG